MVPCPFDCRLSDWSSWSPCSSSCGPGVRVRSKWLKEKPYNGGRPCPKLDLRNQVSDIPMASRNHSVLCFESGSKVTVLLEELKIGVISGTTPWVTFCRQSLTFLGTEGEVLMYQQYLTWNTVFLTWGNCYLPKHRKPWINNPTWTAWRLQRTQMSWIL